MGRSQETFSKKEREKKRLKKREEKSIKKSERKENQTGGDLDNMMAYVDEMGNITDTPPDTTKRKKVSLSSIEISIPKRTDEEQETEFVGIVIYFNEEKGFGFIKSDRSVENIFFHHKNVQSEVKKDNKVSFELEQTPKGLAAINVKLHKD